MPSLLGGFISIIVAGTASNASSAAAGLLKKQPQQALAQFLGLLVCLSFALLTGMFTGVIMQKWGPPKGSNVQEFHDAVWWEIGGGEESDFHEKAKVTDEVKQLAIELSECLPKTAENTL